MANGANLRAMDLEAMEAFVADLGERPFRAKQIHRWVHQRGARSIEEMTDLSKGFRAKLADAAELPSLEIDTVQRGTDGTAKYALRTSKGDIVEAVFIPDASAKGRNTLCISSQVGCAIDCKFCLTASLGLIRNLSAGEIVEQLVRVRHDLGDDYPIQNVVMMGMGEPLQNYSAVVQSVLIMSAEDGPRLSPRRITVSTAGLAPRIPRLGHDTNVNLAISLNATTDEVRDRIMPINKKWNIAALLDACREFPLAARRRITFEYVLLAGVNDTDDDARRLVKLLRGFRCKVNLIPFNEHPHSSYKRPSQDVVDRFQGILIDKKLSVFVRTPRGDDISAACGQLGAEVHARLPVVQ